MDIQRSIEDDEVGEAREVGPYVMGGYISPVYMKKSICNGSEGSMRGDWLPMWGSTAGTSND